MEEYILSIFSWDGRIRLLMQCRRLVCCSVYSICFLPQYLLWANHHFGHNCQMDYCYLFKKIARWKTFV